MSSTIDEDIKRINRLPLSKLKYLYDECDTWVSNNYWRYEKRFRGKGSIVIVAILSNKQLLHCFFSNYKTDKCYDVRGEFDSCEDILRYTGSSYENDDLEEYVFDTEEDFTRFLDWLSFENKKDKYKVR